ncbi:MAG TPA: hypothetical protein PLZ75_05700, partial [Bacteroidales bacterium]|nr:hypothetical protein [Bacteroidales bacterium]
ADIFRNKTIAEILYFLKILPVYRIRDGFSSLKENDEIFKKTVDVLRNKNGLVILPEGDHAGYRRLRQLKKGICRIAFQADEASGFEMKIKIIPVGLEFTNYQRFRQVLTVVYGKAVEVDEYHELYRKNPEVAHNQLRERLSGEMKMLMVHIDSKEDYEAIDELRSLVNGPYSDDVRFPKLFRDRMLIDKLNNLKITNTELYRKICSLSLNVKQKAGELKIDYPLLRKNRHPLGWLIAGIFGLIASLPVFIYGTIFTLVFLGIPNSQIPKIRDKQFHSSIKYGISVGLALVFIPVFLIAFLLIFSPFWLGLILFLALPVSGLFAVNYIHYLKRITGGFRIRKYLRRNDSEYMKLKSDHDELIKQIGKLA